MQTDIDRIIHRLAEAVQRLPLDTMVSRVWFPGHPEITQNVQELETSARDAITRLSTLAGAGRDDAAVALRNIGYHAATELESFILPPASKGSRRKISTTPGPFKESVILTLPVVEINGDLSSVVDVLRSEGEAIERMTAEEIDHQIIERHIAGRARFVVNALAPLGFPNELLEDHRRMTSVDSVHYNHPNPILQEQLEKTKTVKGETDPEKRQEAVQIALLKLIHHLLEARLEELSIAKAKELPPKSLDWPMCVSAFGRDAQEKVGTLKLGSLLRFRPRGIDNKTGRPSVVEPGSGIHFALEYCIALDDVRRTHLHSTSGQKAAWKKSIEDIEVALKEKKLADPLKKKKLADLFKKKKLGNPPHTYSDDPYHGVSLCFLWTYKAALLPEFPSVDLKSNDAAKSDLNLWLDAAVARARMMCWNDWENYKGWPACVEVRHHSKGRGRSMASVVREKMKDGMVQLESVPSAVRLANG